MLASSSNICRSWNDGPCRWPFGQCRYCHCCKKCQGEHPLFNRPSQASQFDSQLPCHKVNASGVSMVARSIQPILRRNFVHIPGSVRFSNVVFPILVNVVTLTQDAFDKLPVTSAQAFCPNFFSFIDCLQQDLVSPSRVTPIDAEKPWCELYFHSFSSLSLLCMK